MKRLLLSAIAIAVLAAGCGSGGGSTSVAHKTKTTRQHTSTRRIKKVVHHKVVHHKKVVHHHRKSVVVTSSAMTTTAATTTYTPPPTSTSTTTPPPPPPTSTKTVVPTTTRQTTTHHSVHHTSTTTQGYCLSVTTVIGTPRGSVHVAQVKPGMFVWSRNLRGQRVSEKVLEVHHTHVPTSHLMVRLRLADGRHLLVSLGHPLPSGRPVSSLVAGQSFEGSRVLSATRVRYGRSYTYDLLPAGPTHTYFANGILMGSTLAAPGAVAGHPF